MDNAAVPVSLWLWRLALRGLGAVLVIGGLGALLLAGGLADPPRAGPLQWLAETAPPDCLNVERLTLPTLAPPVTVELVAALAGNAPQATAWGLRLESPDATLHLEVLPPGYYSRDGLTFPFHHVQADDNELRLDLADGRYTLRLNRERAAAGDAPAPLLAWTLSGGAGVCWRRVALYGPD